MNAMSGPGQLVEVITRVNFVKTKILRMPQSSRGLDMELRLTHECREAHITLYTSEQTRNIAMAWGPVSTLRVGGADDFPVIWIGSSACFELTTEAAAAVRAFLTDNKVPQ
jgi:hypothetical protein